MLHVSFMELSSRVVRPDGSVMPTCGMLLLEKSEVEVRKVVKKCLRL